MMDINLSGIREQFTGLNPNEPQSWPLLPRLAVMAAVGAFVLAGSWYFVLSSQRAQLQQEQNQEVQLKQTYTEKAQEAASLDLLLMQKAQAQQAVSALERQLPNASEMDALLSDINSAGIGRGLSFSLFQPQSVIFHGQYAELPIKIEISGRYDDLAGFMTDLAHLSRIVTMDNIHLLVQPAKINGQGRAQPQDTGSPTLTLQAVVHTYRYLSQDEIDTLAAEKRAKKNHHGA